MSLMGKTRNVGAFQSAMIFIFFLAVAVLMTWPLAAELGAVLPGPSDDALLHYWNGWYVGDALAGGRSPFQTDLLFFPDGVSMAYHNLAWLNILPWLLLRQFMSGIVAYNLVLLLHLAAAGFAAYLLAHHLTGQRAVALVAGVIYLAWPFRLTQLDHPNLISTLFVPLFFLFLMRLLEKRRRREMVAAGLCLALVGYTRWQLLIPVAVLILLFLVGFYRRWLTDRRLLGLLAGTALLSILLLTPAISLLVTEQYRSEAGSDDLLRSGEETSMATDLMAYVTPSPDHFLWGRWTEPIYDRFYPDRSGARRFSAYIGWSVLLLALLGVWQNGRRAVPWLLMAAGMILLALGATLRINGHFYPEIPTLFSLSEPLLIFRLIRVPDRFNIFLALPTAMLAAYGAASLLRTLVRDPRRAGFLTAALLLLVLLDYGQMPIPSRATAISAVYAGLEGEAEGALLELPINTLRAKEYMFAQQIHQRPLLFGHVSRLPAGAFSFIDGHPLLRELRRVDEFPPWQPDVSRQLGSLYDVGVSLITLQKQGQGPDRFLHWQRYLAIEPRYEDEEVAVYTLAPEAGRDFALQEELAPGLGPIRALVSADCFAPGDMLAVDVAWGSEAPLTQAYEVELHLMNQAGAGFTSAAAVLVAGWPTQQWPANTVAWGYYSWQLPATVPAGDYTLQLRLAGQAGNGFTLGTIRISSEECQVPLPAAAKPLAASFGDQMRALGYELEQQGDRLFLTLYWRAEQHMANDYRVFVHVFPTTSDVPVAQDDSFPRRGGFPTRFWYIGEIVADRIPVDLSAIPAGKYGVAIGVYDPVTAERLPLRLTDSVLVSDSRLVLTSDAITIER